MKRIPKPAFLVLFLWWTCAPKSIVGTYNLKSKYAYSHQIILNADSTYSDCVWFCSMGRVNHFGKWRLQNGSVLLQTTLNVNNIKLLCDTVDDGKDIITVDMKGPGFKEENYLYQSTKENIRVLFNDSLQFATRSFPVVFFKHPTLNAHIDSFKVQFSPPDNGICCLRYPEYSSVTVYPDASKKSLHYYFDLAEAPSLFFYDMDTSSYKIGNRKLITYFVNDKGRSYKKARFIKQ